MQRRVMKFETMLMQTTKERCLEILQELPSVCPPRPTRQSVRELRHAIHRGYSAGGKTQAKVCAAFGINSDYVVFE